MTKIIFGIKVYCEQRECSHWLDEPVLKSIALELICPNVSDIKIWCLGTARSFEKGWRRKKGMLTFCAATYWKMTDKMIFLVLNDDKKVRNYPWVPILELCQNWGCALLCSKWWAWRQSLVKRADEKDKDEYKKMGVCGFSKAQNIHRNVLGVSRLQDLEA